jgi:hypothetical protein
MQMHRIIHYTVQPQRNTKFRGLMKFSSSGCRAKPYRLHSRRDGGITAQCASRCQADSRYAERPAPLPPNQRVSRGNRTRRLCSVHSHTCTVTTGFRYRQHDTLKVNVQNQVLARYFVSRILSKTRVTVTSNEITILHPALGIGHPVCFSSFF